ncbi:carboxypeptidase-like regulatory domain-containing protein [Terriglobus roseus]|uniref:Carboxypeptidase regulatory-like domain-containing protein n=1 Tax=Terriglobus roseus TaxID=392734 RepID=A0A1H4MNU0_9BACT|nr:carboxypeptidase-like regulatory domain-containing protein [Terriglobus roseus]SEB84185.1 Carboxypeptidase regulatory-like domain-containing protein [Terriglobus roseus]
MKRKLSVTIVRHAAALLALTACLAGTAQQASAPRLLNAQYTRNTPRNITGTVHDGGNEPLRGAVVQVEQEGTMVIQSYVTDERGTYRIRNLSSNSDYQVWATFRGHHSKHFDISKFDKQADRDIALVIDLTKE